jgi:hypothetical protein
MDIATVGSELENDFLRRLEIYEIKHRIFKIKTESIPVLDIDCYLVPRTGSTCYRNFIFPVKIDLNGLVIDYKDYEISSAEISKCLE